MKTFSPSILSESSIKTNKTTTLKSITEEQDALIKALQFDEETAETEYKSKCDYYIGLLMQMNGKTQPNIDTVLAPMFTKYESLRDAIMMLNISDDEKFNEVQDKYSAIRAAASYQIPDKILTLKCITNTPNINFYDTYGVFRNYCNTIVDNIDHLTEEMINKDLKKEIMMILSNSNKSMQEFLDQCYIDCKIGEFEAKCVSFRDGCDICDDNSFYVNEIAYQGGTNNFISFLKVNTHKFNNPNDVRTIINNICDGMYLLAYISLKLKENKRRNKYRCMVMNYNIIKAALEESPKGFREAMTMFGDEIDSKSIFDDLDEDDFYNSDYMKLGFEADHDYNMAKLEAYSYGASFEASLIGNGQYDCLGLVQEAVGRQIKAAFQKAIEALKAIAKKFVEKILFNFGTEKAWLTKYKNIILNNTFAGDTPITLYSNIGNAIQYIEKVIPPTISYNELMNDGGAAAFENEEAFFDHYFVKKNMFPGLNNAKHIPNDANIADKCKIFLGAKFPNGESEQTTFGQLNNGTTKISNMYNWLLNTEKLAKTTQQQISAMDRTVKNYIASAAAYGAKEETKPAAPIEKTESYVSYIYGGKLIDEADVGKAPTENNNAPATNENNKPAENTSGNPSPDSLKKTTGDTDAEVKKSQDKDSVIQGRMEIYIKVCRAVLTAKMTAISFAHKEMLDIMRAVVKAKLGNSADIKLAVNTGEQKPAEGQQAPQNPKPEGNK